MTEELVSVVMPCYNAAATIKESIASVLAQTYDALELLIVDDGSKDSSRSVVKAYTDPRVRYFYQENGGSASARNHGIREARGQYLALLDADDLWDSTFLEKQIRFLREKDAVAVCCSYRRIDENSRVIMRETHAKPIITVKDMRVMNRVGCLTGLYDMKRYGKLFLKEELKSVRDDYAFWYEVVALEGKIYGNPEILASYRVLSGSTTGNKRRLVKSQYHFYRTCLEEAPLTALLNLLRWGISGLIKFGGSKAGKHL